MSETLPNVPTDSESATTVKNDNISVTKDAVKMEAKVELVMDPDKLRCLNSKEGITTTITVIT